MKAIVLANEKRIVITTTLVEAHCGLNHFIREILTKYLSKVITELNLKSYKEYMHSDPDRLIDAACGYYFCNHGSIYCGMSINWHFSNRHAIVVHNNYHN